MSKKLFEKVYPFGFEVNKYEGDRNYTITGNLRREYCFKEYGSNYDVEEHIQEHINCDGISFDSEFSQFFAYADTEERAIQFCEDIQTWFRNIKELIG
jgi:hypothetical protein